MAKTVSSSMGAGVRPLAGGAGSAWGSESDDLSPGPWRVHALIPPQPSGLKSAGGPLQRRDA
eukprot:11065182-Alexandrium_andersonii.AAC.1